MSLATREIFLRKSERRFKDVTLPASGVTVRIQSLSELEKTEYQRAMYDKAGDPIPGRVRDSKARLICLCLVDETGKKLLLPGDEQDILELDSKDTSYLWDECIKHISFDPQDVKADAKN